MIATSIESGMADAIRRHRLLLADEHFDAAPLEGLDEFRVRGFVGDETTQLPHPGEKERGFLAEFRAIRQNGPECQPVNRPRNTVLPGYCQAEISSCVNVGSDISLSA